MPVAATSAIATHSTTGVATFNIGSSAPAAPRQRAPSEVTPIKQGKDDRHFHDADTVVVNSIRCEGDGRTGAHRFAEGIFGA